VPVREKLQLPAAQLRLAPALGAPVVPPVSAPLRSVVPRVARRTALASRSALVAPTARAFLALAAAVFLGQALEALAGVRFPSPGRSETLRQVQFEIAKVGWGRRLVTHDPSTLARDPSKVEKKMAC
jgi:hypothetical protein